ncbi:MAG TPA: ABC transporter permease subunit [Marmoricola sp.]|nr:ABC transporter permease subunit [Marmoricola sp.]
MTGRVARGLLFLGFGLYFFIPLLAMLDFSTRNLLEGGRTWDAWKALGADPQVRSAILASLGLSVCTVALMLGLLLPTMVWVRLRLPRLSRVVEFLCLLPLTIPALVIVVGLSGVYAWVNYFFGYSPLVLTFAYAVLVLPYSYRALDAALGAIDVRTLAEAARSLGAGWSTVIVRVVVPNVWGGVLSAAFISVALVLGEYTIASLLNYDTLPVVIALLGKSSGTVSVAASLASILFAALLLLLLSFVHRRRTPRGS